MKRVFITMACLQALACLNAQGITLLYKGNGGWNDPLSWIQINIPSTQTPIQKVPTELDDIVISSSLSGLSTVRFNSDNVNPDFNIGSNISTGYRCRSMHVSNTWLSFSSPLYVDASPTLNVYTSNGGFVIIDSGSNLAYGQLALHGGNTAITDLQIINSTYGGLFSHASWTGIGADSASKSRFINSTMGGFVMNFLSGSEMYADSCTFNTTNFSLGDNSTDTVLNSNIQNDLDNPYMTFLIGRNANFVSGKVNVRSATELNFTTSGSVFNGNVSTGGPGSGADFLQEDPANPLPNIINGNFGSDEMNSIGISGDLKISGNFGGFSDDFFNDPAHVIVNSQDVFDVAGITNYQHTVSINNCVNNFCHYKLEFFGSTNSEIGWIGGFPVDTLVINKTGCAKVTCDSSLYVSGATRIESCQLVLNPNDNYPYKFVCAGNVDIAQGSGLFLRRNATGVAANMAVGGTLTDHNPSADSTCAGFSNPYNGTLTFYNVLLPVTVLDFYGQYNDGTVALTWSTTNEINTKYFTIEKSFDQASFLPLVNIPVLGNVQSKKDYQYVDNTSLKGINYYRLKMLDADGRFTYSKIIAIGAPLINSVMVFPNPVKDKLFIRLPGITAETEIIIADAKGSCVKKLQLKAETTETSINIAGLSAGVYSISFQSAILQNTQQFIKQ